MFRVTPVLLLMIFCLSVIAADKQMPNLDCKNQPQSVRTICESIETKHLKLRQLQNLLKDRFDYINSIKNGVEAFCDVDKRLMQNEGAIERIVQAVLPFDCAGESSKLIRSGCQFIQDDYAQLNQFRIGQDQEVDKLRRLSLKCDDEGPYFPAPVDTGNGEHEPDVSLGSENVQDCSAVDTPSTFVYKQGSKVNRHQAHSWESSKFKKTQLDLKGEAKSGQYYLQIISQRWLSPYVFVVGTPEENDSLLFQAYCRSDFSLAYSQVIPASKIVENDEYIEVDPQIYASLVNEGFALKVAPKKMLVWTLSKDKEPIIMAANSPILAVSLAIDENTGDLRLTSLDENGNLVSKGVENQNPLFSKKVSALGDNLHFLRLIDENNKIFVLTSQRTHLFLGDTSKKPLYQSDHQNMMGMASFFLYQSDSDQAPDYGLGFLVCESDKKGYPYKIELHRITGAGIIKDKKVVALDHQWSGSTLSCEAMINAGGVKLFIRSNDTDGEEFSFVLVRNHKKGQVSVFDARKDFISDQWETIQKENIELKKTINPLFIRVVGDFGSIERIYYFFEKGAIFNIDINK